MRSFMIRPSIFHLQRCLSHTVPVYQPLTTRQHDNTTVHYKAPHRRDNCYLIHTVQYRYKPYKPITSPYYVLRITYCTPLDTNIASYLHWMEKAPLSCRQ